MSYNVYSLKLTTGEEIIAKSENVLDSWWDSPSVIIQNPLTLVQTQQGIGAMPWLGTGETEEITIPTTQIIAVAKSKSEVQSMYIKSTSGIDIASADTSSILM